MEVSDHFNVGSLTRSKRVSRLCWHGHGQGYMRQAGRAVVKGGN
jgi:hypothetical protein